jgi:Fur family zinc uptake transcriptional regulator
MMVQACAHTHDAGGLTGAALGSRLSAAEALCARREQRLTPPRRRVLQLLLEAGQPVKAYDLMAAYDPAAPAKPPTVYRALEFLEREGFAHRIESLNAFVACGQPLAGETQVHAAAFLICDCCGAAREFEARLGDQLGGSAEAAGYQVHAVTIEAHGLCLSCREA